MMKTGILYIVGTPIGNLADLTPRARDVLEKIDTIACEDTRRTKQLLERTGITGKKRLLAHHQGNERKSAQGLLQLLEKGTDMIYVSDSGMPSISDPGYFLVQTARKAGLEVRPVPGVSALTTALAGSGLPASRFTFLGFLPRKPGEKQRLLERFVEAPEALVIYESPQRLAKTLAIAAEVFGPREACVCRELTKVHEEFNSAPLPNLAEHYAEAEVKGEITLIISGGK